MSTCAFKNCKSNRRSKTPGITFHKFPKSETRKLEWIKAVGKENFIPSANAVVCSNHFKENDFDRSSPFVTLLKDGAIPLTNLDSQMHVEHQSDRTYIYADDYSAVRRDDTVSCKEFDHAGVQKKPFASLANLNCKTPEVRMHASAVYPGLENNDLKKSYELAIENATLKRKLEKALKENDEHAKKMKKQDRIIRKQEQQIQDLSSLIERLKSERLINQEAMDRLYTVAPANKEFLLRQLAAVSDDIKAPREYSAELKAFALTLHYYSPNAYDHVRDYFKLSLPCDRTISKWYSKIDASPGFTAESFKVLKHAAKNTNYKIVCSLIMDEMAIRPHLEWDGHKYHGFVDTGVETGEDNLPLAKNALVFMVVGINTSWKIPVGYFLIEGMTAQQRASLVKKCLILLQPTGIKVVSLTCDGLITNLSTARALGCNFSLDNMKTTFKHPVDTEDDVAFILDPCHMLKLVRNTLGEKKIAADQNNKQIKWEFVEKLQEIQTLEGLKLGNSLSQHHTNFYAQKMKVKLASQLLSSSVADAIEHCDKDLHHEDFKGSEATVEFIRNFDALFDILNSRNLTQKYLKKPINERNEDEIIQRLNYSYNYILHLKEDKNGGALVDSGRRTGFLGFLICIKSMIHLYNTLVKSETPLLKYLPMYKFSQDHLELFFARIRAHLGCNTNPTARQFRSAYRKLLVKAEIKNSKGANCTDLENISILSTSSTDSIKIINSSTDKKLLDDSSCLISVPPLYTDHDYVQCSGALTEFASSVVEFIAGYVSRQLTDSLKCIHCVSVLTNDVAVRSNSLITRKNKGGLVYPSSDVYKISKRCEQIFRIAKESGGKKLSAEVLSISALRSLQHENLFPELDEHMHDTNPLENHTVHLIRAIADKYFKIRLFSHGKSLVDTKNYMKNVSHKLENIKNLKKWTGQ